MTNEEFGQQYVPYLRIADRFFAHPEKLDEMSVEEKKELHATLSTEAESLRLCAQNLDILVNLIEQSIEKG